MGERLGGVDAQVYDDRSEEGGVFCDARTKFMLLAASTSAFESASMACSIVSRAPPPLSRFVPRCCCSSACTCTRHQLIAPLSARVHLFLGGGGVGGEGGRITRATDQGGLGPYEGVLRSFAPPPHPRTHLSAVMNAYGPQRIRSHW